MLRKFCDDFGYEPVKFRSESEPGRPIYHTNVMMCVGSEFALVGLENIPDEAERMGVQNLLEASGKEVIELTPAQIAEFAGNAIELHNENGKLLVLSARAAAALTSRATRRRSSDMRNLCRSRSPRSSSPAAARVA